MAISTLISSLDELIYQFLIVFLVLFFWIYFFIFWIGFLESKSDLFLPKRADLSGEDFTDQTFIGVYLPKNAKLQSRSGAYSLVSALEDEQRRFEEENKWLQTYQSIQNDDGSGVQLASTWNKRPKKGVTFLETPIFKSRGPRRFFPSPLQTLISYGSGTGSNTYSKTPIKELPRRPPILRKSSGFQNSGSASGRYQNSNESRSQSQSKEFPCGNLISFLGQNTTKRNDRDMVVANSRSMPGNSGSLFDTGLSYYNRSNPEQKLFTGIDGEVTDHSELYRNPTVNYNFYARKET